jgi:hypothetical protein
MEMLPCEFFAVKPFFTAKNAPLIPFPVFVFAGTITPFAQRLNMVE